MAIITKIDRRAIQQYVDRLGCALVERYGAEGSYSIAQVRTTIAGERMSLAHLAYACAMFCGRGEFARWMQDLGGPVETLAAPESVGHPYREALGIPPCKRTQPLAHFEALYDELRRD